MGNERAEGRAEDRGRHQAGPDPGVPGDQGQGGGDHGLHGGGAGTAVPVLHARPAQQARRHRRHLPRRRHRHRRRAVHPRVRSRAPRRHPGDRRAPADAEAGRDRHGRAEVRDRGRGHRGPARAVLQCLRGAVAVRPQLRGRARDHDQVREDPGAGGRQAPAGGHRGRSAGHRAVGGERAVDQRPDDHRRPPGSSPRLAATSAAPHHPSGWQ